jgi:sulfatase maturation enzyme AslB (radical SAM superfamily)
MTFATAKKVASFFSPFLTDKYNLNFYGGEPLLCFDLIKETLAFLEPKNNKYRKTPHYSLTTNGSLISDEILQILEAYKFSAVFSFDGYAQEINRKKGSFHQAVSNLKKIHQYPNIQLEVNSVFTPETVSYISRSMELIMSLGVGDINLSFSMLKPWNNHSFEQLKEELKRLRRILVGFYREKQEIPIKSYRKEDTKGYFYCAAGQDRMAVTFEEHVWGCDLFADYFRRKENWHKYKDYFFGDLNTFTKYHKKIYPKISSNYANLSMDNFATPSRSCLFCPDLENCSVCPMVAALAGSSIGEIPSYVCEIKKIRIIEQHKFLEEIFTIS